MTRPSPQPVSPLRLGLESLKGIGPYKARQLARLGLHTLQDVLFYFPRDYDDWTQQVPLSRLVPGMEVRAVGRVVDLDGRSLGPRRQLVTMVIHDGSGELRAVWFNTDYVLRMVRHGQWVALSGKVRTGREGRLEMSHPRVERIHSPEEHRGRILPVYRLCQGVSQRDLHLAVRSALAAAAGHLEDVLPEDFRREKNLVGIEEALHGIHFPEDHDHLRRARHRLVYQELLVLQLAMQLHRQRLQKEKSVPLEVTAKIDGRIRRLFPFELTPDQNQAVAEVAADLARPFPMHRLLQGDVGSGKTVVAVYAMLAAVAHGYQAALMVPTEILAQQHYHTLRTLLRKSRVRLELISGTLSPKQRKELLGHIKAGTVDMVVGTQALIQNDVQFARLAVVVIDEQHKFGVEQRARLQRAGPWHPHYLVMTATPIPRTLLMTQFGDLDVSVLRDKPPGRRGVRTYLVRPDQEARWWQFVRKKLDQGRQGYVVVPRVEESEEAASVEETLRRLQQDQLAGYRLAAVHGRMRPADKQQAMEQFAAGEVQVLVCTTAIEVGVDVPNATVLTILEGQRFGLAQLHQLRGRIGRGRHLGHCGVFARIENEEAQQRLQAFVETDDGFRLAELDYRLRGPGHMLGTQQHGQAPLYIARLPEDQPWLEEARTDAARLLAHDPLLQQPRWAKLRRLVLRRYGQVMDLSHVG